MRTLASSLLLLCACSPAAKSEPAAPVEPAAATAAAAASSAPSTAAAEPASSARKRTRTAKAAPLERDGTKPKNGKPLNPHDAMGRTVFVRADDHCFVEVPSKTPPTGDGPVTPATEVVDCPPEANDPAYDHCTSQIVLEQGASPAKCYCVTGAGAKRMPFPTPCPRGVP